MKYGRAHWFRPSELDQDQHNLYQQLIGGARASDPIGRGAAGLVDEKGRLYGPHNVRLLDPRVGGAIANLSETLRFGLSVSPRVAEICILETARSERSNYIWPAHEARARKLGITEADIAAIRTGGSPEALSEEEQCARRVTQWLLREGDLTDLQFAEAERTLGPSWIFDIVTLVGHYRHTALSLRVWRTPLRPEDPPTFPEQ